MKRKTKLLLLVVIAISSILGTYLINGCGDKKVTTPPKSFTIQGVVKSANTNEPITGATVACVKDTTKTDSRGFWIIHNFTESGDYVFEFTKDGYAGLHKTVFGDIDSATVHLYGNMYELNAKVTGYLLATTASGGVSAKNGNANRTVLDTLLHPSSPAPAGTKVQISFDSYYFDGEHIQTGIWPAIYETTTDATGHFVFENLPAVTSGSVTLSTAGFSGGADSTFVPTDQQITLRFNQTLALDPIRAELAGENPMVLSIVPQTTTRMALNSPIVLTFTRPIDTAAFRFTLYENWDPFSEGGNVIVGAPYAWSNGNTVLTITPAIAFRPDDIIHLVINACKATNGKYLTGDHNWNINTVQGMRFVGTNLTINNQFIGFPLDSNIRICFDMPPVNPVGTTTLAGDTIIFTDASNSQRVDFTATVSGNCLIIDPNNRLESGRTYNLSFVIYSTQSNRVTYNQNLITNYGGQFTGKDESVVPIKPVGFATNMGSTWKADYNTTNICFKWNKVTGAKQYQIFARDNGRNTDFVQVANGITANDFVQWDSGCVDLGSVANSQFDVYTTDAIVTPFTNGNKIWFKVRAGNTAGFGPFSDSILVSDQTAPTFSVVQVGDADNTLGATEDSSATLSISQNEYMLLASTNPTFTFVEAGGDPSYVLPNTAVTWTWANDVRSWTGKIHVPAGKGGAGDLLIVHMKDNSGNEGVDTITVGAVYKIWAKNNDLDVSNDTTSWEAPTGRAKWTSSIGQNSTDSFYIYRSYDGGTTWKDTTVVTWLDGISDNHYHDFTVSDTLRVNDNAMLGWRRYHGGVLWKGQKFTINGIKVTGPDSAWVAAHPKIYDRARSDSTGIPVTWNSYGLTKVVIWYRYNGGALVSSDTVTCVAGNNTHTWYPPSHSQNYTAQVFVRDFDADQRPYDSTKAVAQFTVRHDTLIWVYPLAGNTMPGGDTVSNIRWNNYGTGAGALDTLSSLLDIYYAIDPVAPDTTWLPIKLNTENDGFYTWDTVPYSKPSDSAFIKIKDKNPADTLAYVSARFKISGMKMLRPVGGSCWKDGATKYIAWKNYGGFSGWVRAQYTLDGGTTWTNLGGNDSLNVVADVTDSIPWVIPNKPHAGVKVRVIKIPVVATSVRAVSDTFSLSGYTLTYPAQTTTWLIGRTDSVMWTTVGNCLNTTVNLYFRDTGDASITKVIASGVSNSGKYVFAVPTLRTGVTPPLTTARVRVAENGGTAADTSDADFTIDQPIIDSIFPGKGTTDTVQMGTTRTITWHSVGIRAANLIITLDTANAGTYDITIATVAGSATTYNWLVPNLGAALKAGCHIKVQEVGYPLVGTSANPFWIKP